MTAVGAPVRRASVRVACQAARCAPRSVRSLSAWVAWRPSVAAQPLRRARAARRGLTKLSSIAEDGAAASALSVGSTRLRTSSATAGRRRSMVSISARWAGVSSRPRSRADNSSERRTMSGARIAWGTAGVADVAGAGAGGGVAVDGGGAAGGVGACARAAPHGSAAASTRARIRGTRMTVRAGSGASWADHTARSPPAGAADARPRVLEPGRHHGGDAIAPWRCSLEGGRGAQNGGLRAAPTDDLQSDGQAGGGESAWDGDRGEPGHRDAIGEEEPLRVVVERLAVDLGRPGLLHRKGRYR